jgi:gliding motility-associated lipoprotein GldH
MRICFPVLILAIFFVACDESRVYEQNHDFEDRLWPAAEKPEFEFEVKDTLVNYNLYCDIRNSIAFPYTRLFVHYYLEDSTGALLQKKLTSTYLFDQNSGKPLGTSGLGDIYDHRTPILNNYHFPYSGKYRIRFEQYMRIDTIPGILATGLRVEKAGFPEKN